MIVFLDCGAHCGESILRAKAQFGKNIKIVSFEPIPYFAKEIDRIWEGDESVDIVNAAVWIRDGLDTFQVSTKITDGSSLIEEHGKGWQDEELAIEVNTVDFSKFLKQFKDKDFKLIVKFDIEGAEYQVLNKMINDETIGYVDEFWGEWHVPLTKEQEKCKTIIFEYFNKHNIQFKEWEQHIPTVGKAHPMLVERPKFLKDILC